tara:strand:- start:3617 stop:4645 length:1029 start_codon:yes stop_codon:yes gene_type:complete
MATPEKPIALQTDKDKAVSSFEDYLDPSEDNVEQSNENETEQEETLVEEANEDSNNEDLVEDSENESEEDDDDLEEELEEVNDVEQDLEEDQEQPNFISVKIDGVEHEVTLDELKNGYSRQQDYTRKTQKLAEQTKSVLQKEKDISQKEVLYNQLIPKLEQELKQDLVDNEPNWEKMVDEDPIEYVRQKQVWDKKRAKHEKVLAEKKRIENEAIVKRQKQIEQIVNEGNIKLSQSIPEWKNDKIREKEFSQIKKYAIESLGFNEQEIDNVIDYRAILGLRQAWKYSQTQEAIKKKPTQSPARVARPGSTNKPVKTSAIKKERQRLKKSGKVSDAAKVFQRII